MKKNFDEMVIKAQIKSNGVKDKVIEVLSNNNGNFLEEAMKYAGGLVVGILFLGGMYVLFKGTIIPTLGVKVKEIFDFKG